MKKSLILIGALCASVGMKAQTLNVNIGEVTYAHSSSAVGDMPFSGGTTLTVQGKTYTLSEVSSIKVDNSVVADNTVSITYNGNSAAVVVAGNLAQYATVTASGANVSVILDANVTDEVTYTLSGNSSNGSFYMDGEANANIVLSDLTLTNTAGAAIDVEDGKKIGVVITGTNTLVDGASGDQDACLFINGHAEISGTGTLAITGNKKHGYASDEYTVLSSGTITVNSAATDGFHINQYFKMDGGSVTINSSADGLDVGKTKDDTDTYNGQLFINGGELTIVSAGDGNKAIKAETSITVTGGTTTATSNGSACWDDTALDISGTAAAKTDGTFTMTDGTMKLYSNGAGGKGLNAGGDISVSGGNFTVVTTGATYTYGTEDTKPHAVKTDGNISVTGGNVYVAASQDGRAFDTDYYFVLNGGTLMGVGGKKSEPTSATQTYKTYKGVSVSAGSTVTYNNVSFTVPTNYSVSDAKVLVSSPNM